MGPPRGPNVLGGTKDRPNNGTGTGEGGRQPAFLEFVMERDVGWFPVVISEPSRTEIWCWGLLGACWLVGRNCQEVSWGHGNSRELLKNTWKVPS